MTKDEKRKILHQIKEERERDWPTPWRDISQLLGQKGNWASVFWKRNHYLLEEPEEVRPKSITPTMRQVSPKDQPQRISSDQIRTAIFVLTGKSSRDTIAGAREKLIRLLQGLDDTGTILT